MNYEYVIKILQRAEAVEPMQPVYKDDADYNRVEKIIIAARAEALEEAAKWFEDEEHPLQPKKVAAAIRGLK